MIRKWLRALIGWKDVGAALKAMREHIGRLEDLILAQGKEIEALRYQRDMREQKKQQSQVVDWEQQIAEYAANPENFKEN